MKHFFFPRRQGIFFTVVLVVAWNTAMGTALASESVEEYMDLPLEDLLSVKVTSVSKKKQQLNEVASAVFVISREDILRSGVTSIPEALRMAPGIHVARIDANKWAITSRGFGSQFSNKLLVMIDGRTVYSPSYSGVYWDVQDTLLDDIDRIEVIRGPGASVWGANAVNGVINIITRQASETTGGLMVAGAGNEEKGFASLRYGAALGEDTYGRIYMKYSNRDASYLRELDGDAGDSWKSLRGGFRVDGHTGRNTSWTLQGDSYNSDENQRINLWKDPTDPANMMYAPYYMQAATPDATDSSGGNLLGKWNHRLSETAGMALQIYYDHTRRSEALLTQTHDTVDIDFQHQFQFLETQDIIWGLGYRFIHDRFDNTFMVSLLPDSRDLDLFSAFVQDQVNLTDRLCLTLGSKFEHNDYTGFEIQPSVRLAWRMSDRSMAWGAISRAVRTPSRLEDSAEVISQIVPVPPAGNPVVLRVYRNPAVKSETLVAYELGYRVQARDNLSLDVAFFYNNYDDLQTFEDNDPGNLLSNSVFGNRMSADSYGFELSLDWRPLEWWRLQANYSLLEVSASLDAGSSDRTGSDRVAEGSSPNNQFSIRSLMDLSHQVSLDVWIYYVDELEKSSFFWNESVPGYTSCNVRLAWRPAKNIELSLVGQNLTDSHHLEFIGENVYLQAEMERSVYGQVRLNF